MKALKGTHSRFVTRQGWIRAGPVIAEDEKTITVKDEKTGATCILTRESIESIEIFDEVGE